MSLESISNQQAPNSSQRPADAVEAIEIVRELAELFQQCQQDQKPYIGHLQTKLQEKRIAELSPLKIKELCTAAKEFFQKERLEKLIKKISIVQFLMLIAETILGSSKT